jgi:hypothetical protein
MQDCFRLVIAGMLKNDVKYMFYLFYSDKVTAFCKINADVRSAGERSVLRKKESFRTYGLQLFLYEEYRLVYDKGHIQNTM